jgi:hypothetical protein
MFYYEIMDINPYFFIFIFDDGLPVTVYIIILLKVSIYFRYGYTQKTALFF